MPETFDPSQIPPLFEFVFLFVVGLIMIASGLIGWLILDRINRHRIRVAKDRLRRSKERQARESELDDILLHRWEEYYDEFGR